MNDVRLDTIPEAIEAVRAGEIIVVVDDEDRENEGDFVLATESVTPAAINFLSKHGRGLICVAVTGERARELDLPPMVARNEARMLTHFTVSVDAAEGVTTGISAYDRALTIGVFADSDARAGPPKSASNRGDVMVRPPT